MKSYITYLRLFYFLLMNLGFLPSYLYYMKSGIFVYGNKDIFINAVVPSSPLSIVKPHALIMLIWIFACVYQCYSKGKHYHIFVGYFSITLCFGNVFHLLVHTITEYSSMFEKYKKGGRVFSLIGCNRFLGVSDSVLLVSLIGIGIMFEIVETLYHIRVKRNLKAHVDHVYMLMFWSSMPGFERVFAILYTYFFEIRLLSSFILQYISGATASITLVFFCYKSLNKTSLFITRIWYTLVVLGGTFLFMFLSFSTIKMSLYGLNSCDTFG